MNHLVSIIIPTYNRAHLIMGTLNSVLEQTYTNWECLVIDDGSTDNTKEIVANYIKSDNRFQYFTRPNHLPKGANACRNYGFEISKGTYIQWFDSDDIMLPEKLALKVQALKNIDVDFVVCEGAVMINSSKFFKKWKLYQSKNALLDHIKGNLVFGTNGPLFYKSYLKNKKLLI